MPLESGRAFRLIHHGALYITALSIIPLLSVSDALLYFVLIALVTRPSRIRSCSVAQDSLITPLADPADVLHAEQSASVGPCPCVQLHINTHRPPCFHS
jgi:hypothetical protein